MTYIQTYVRENSLTEFLDDIIKLGLRRFHDLWTVLDIFTQKALGSSSSIYFNEAYN